MTIVAPLAEFIVREHVARPIRGRVLTLGRQSVSLTTDALCRLLAKYNLPVPSIADIELSPRDAAYTCEALIPPISDRAFFRALGIEKIDALDVSDYEGANIVHDLGDERLPPELHGKYDFIVNGSCLDNMPDPMAALRNTSRLLAKGGRILHMEHGSNFNGPYLVFTPGWFIDYYVYNRFASYSAYVGAFTDPLTLYCGPWRLLELSATEHLGQTWMGLPTTRLITVNNAVAVPHFMLVVLATRGTDSTIDQRAIQFQYRTDKEKVRIGELAKLVRDYPENLKPSPTVAWDRTWRDCGFFGDIKAWSKNETVAASMFTTTQSKM